MKLAGLWVSLAVYAQLFKNILNLVANGCKL